MAYTYSTVTVTVTITTRYPSVRIRTVGHDMAWHGMAWYGPRIPNP